ncbi:DinB family protein [uncultured Roseobacter sp.]|uniref:DinB family protein n=1 Tax=uncultured Roseobacter sp. TaxID=114847 RepID=UPI00260A0D94|nr:DinB family protein [uncultured Roseobacter sp.]
MSAAHPYLRMAQNNAWANATLYAAASTLTDAQAAAPAPGFFPSLRATLDHIYAVDLYYTDALTAGGLGRRVYDREAETSLEALARLQAEADARLISFCAALTPEILTETRQTERPEGPVTERVADLLLHLFQHQVHHRGQAHVQLHSLGTAPPQLDDFHLRYDRAPTAKAYLS